MRTKTTYLRVRAIRNGTVIDHIQPDKALVLARVLGLEKQTSVVTLGLNLKSRTMKQKSLIKIEGKELAPDEAAQIAILAPTATINTVRDYKIVRKAKVSMPEEIKGIVVCPNPRCITNIENIETKFCSVADQDGVYNFRCHYCERVFRGGEIVN